MTYMFDGKQYIAVAAGSTIIALAIQDVDSENCRKLRRSGRTLRDMRTLLIVLLGLVQVAAPAVPHVEISNSRIQAQINLPDAQSGYYRGTRFDWSGVVASLKWNGHEYFGQWFERYDPQIHDAITGPVEEFLTGEAGLGYDEAKPGEPFVRIGVGAVRKPDEPAYRASPPTTSSIPASGRSTKGIGSDRIHASSWATPAATPTSTARRCG